MKQKATFSIPSQLARRVKWGWCLHAMNIAKKCQIKTDYELHRKFLIFTCLSADEELSRWKTNNLSKRIFKPQMGRYKLTILHNL